MRKTTARTQWRYFVPGASQLRRGAPLGIYCSLSHLRAQYNTRRAYWRARANLRWLDGNKVLDVCNKFRGFVNKLEPDEQRKIILVLYRASFVFVVYVRRLMRDRNVYTKCIRKRRGRMYTQKREDASSILYLILGVDWIGEWEILYLNHFNRYHLDIDWQFLFLTITKFECPGDNSTYRAIGSLSLNYSRKNLHLFTIKWLFLLL